MFIICKFNFYFSSRGKRVLNALKTIKMIESSYFNTRATRSRLKENNTTEEVKIEPKKKSVASKLLQQKRKEEIK